MSHFWTDLALFRFMVGCGRCDDWFHGDCVGLDLTKVREMEEEDQMYVCLKCCEDESTKVDPEGPSVTKPEEQAKNELQDNKPPAKPGQGPSQSLTSGGVRPVRKVSDIGLFEDIEIFLVTLWRNVNLYNMHRICCCLCPQLMHPLIFIIASVTTKQGFVAFYFVAHRCLVIMVNSRAFSTICSPETHIFLKTTF